MTVATSDRRVVDRTRPGSALALVAICAVALAVSLGVLAWDVTEPWRAAPPAPRGQLVLPFRGGLATIALQDGTARPLFEAPPGASVTAAAWSPDRRQIAFAMFHRRPDDRVSSGELFLMPAEGGSPTLLVGRDQPGSIVDTPVWAADGTAIYFGYLGIQAGRPIVRVERATVPDGARQPLYDGASFPAVSPDGQELAFVRDEPNGQSLMLGTTGGEAARELVKADVFVSLMGPRFAPDGSRIAFTAVGPGPAASGGNEGYWGWLSVPVAYAHGDPWNVWTVRSDGSELRRVGWLQEDEPLVTWSPDARWLAIHGTGGVWLVDALGATDPRRIAEGGFGAVDWAR